MDNHFEPWIKYPPLTSDRLEVIAELIRSVRHEALGLHEPVAGDNEWSLGCRVYVRTCHALREAAKERTWLSIVREEENLRFTFAIGSIPFRFYHGEAGAPPGRYLIATYGEIHQRQMALKLDGMPSIDGVLRLAVETGATGEVVAVTLVEMDESHTVTETYAVPLDGDASRVVPMQAKAVSLPPPEIEVITPVGEKKAQRKNKDQRR